MDALKGVSDDIQLSVRSTLSAGWEKIRTFPMLLAAVLDTSLSDQKRVVPSPDQLEEIGSWLDANYSSTESETIHSELLCFLQKEGIFNRSRCWTAARNISARIWWKIQFDCALSQLAQKVLSMMPISGSAERNLVDFWIHPFKVAQSAQELQSPEARVSLRQCGCGRARA
ncbi:hypothetical protein V1525DRAFT_162671 [Lipomyces kononenkoae]|uniref:Uncharacterized protein n=1 Tax=Lipomyces kononenkoae TaxID=34357 RepID=A0ACC3T0S0_LIPKO